jgi:hypothetical protein
VTKISKLALIAAIALVGMGSTTFAQSSNPNSGIGAHSARHHKMSPRQGGMSAFDMVPGSAGGSVFSPALTGGGSAGYNENLRQDTW